MPPNEPFDPDAFDEFRITTWDAEAERPLLRLHYELGRHRFTESIEFEAAGPLPIDHPAFRAAVGLLHVAAGVSYYKLAAPSTVSVAAPMAEGARDLALSLYDDGLREYAVVNGLPVPRPVRIVAPASGRGAVAPPAGPLPEGLAVPIGGGKDSMVLVDALRPLGPRLLAVNPRPLVRRLAGAAELELMVVRRELDGDLAGLTATGGRNGHVPITAIVSLLAVVGAFAFGYDTIAMAIERSASEASRSVGGVEVNHQYSKSEAFEGLLRDVLHAEVHPDLGYGSALRPYSELAIARAFARGDRYDDLVCSCNSAFRADADGQRRWCRSCPKCRFVALAMAPFMGRDRTAAMLGGDLFADEAQTAGFAELMGPEKPFECVGERLESAAAMARLGELGEFRDSPVVARLAPVAFALVGDDALGAALEPAVVTGASLGRLDREIRAAVAAWLSPVGVG